MTFHIPPHSLPEQAPEKVPHHLSQPINSTSSIAHALTSITSTPSSTAPTDSAVYAQLTARRAPSPLQPLDLTLLHSPAVASGWSSFLNAIRTQTSLPASIRELCICRVAVLNGADYEWEHHVPLLRDAGLSEAAITEVQSRKAWKGWLQEGGSLGWD